MLAEVKQLESLRLLIKPNRLHEEGDWCDFPTLSNHPIHQGFARNLPNSKLSIVNLVPIWGGDIHDQKYSLHNTYNNATPENFAARDFFEGVKKLGWGVEEMWYGVNQFYPAPEGKDCGNREMCEYIHEGTIEWYAICDCTWREKGMCSCDMV